MKYIEDTVMERQIYKEIKQERKSQNKKWGEQNHKPEKWLAILGEEYGEACKSAIEFDKSSYRKELIQVAAVAVAAIENLDRGEKK
jgi:NTP pyrophosphatase (non-canonical NTP hydrolase)